jgi:hypothetical protein
MIWLTKTEYFESAGVVCAIDDSVKHAMEYAKHGVSVLSPEMSYNAELYDATNVIVYDDPQELLDEILKMAGRR